ncbi:hypothetical protein EDL79_01510 [Ehrlichia ruminantium]|nr:hypothetical protein [Ehrlichia ruminantium]QGR02354.1 hypothetical protein EDL81_01515 [Ehrlichia ruminantium]QGR04198.1 hypothetical protein EDL79_01510 [Ehrlichia ruminantium]
MYWKISSEDIKIIPIDNYEEIMEKSEIILKQLILEYLTEKKPFSASYDISGYDDYNILTCCKINKKPPYHHNRKKTNKPQHYTNECLL